MLLGGVKVGADGELPFSIDHGNLIEVPFGLHALEQAACALRRAQVALRRSGEAAADADLPARYLALPPELEFAAHSLLHNNGLSQQIEPIVSAYLPANRWYLFADPAWQQAIATLQLRGSKSPVRLDPANTPIKIDGAGFKAVADVGAVRTGRLGAIRGLVIA